MKSASSTVLVKNTSYILIQSAPPAPTQCSLRFQQSRPIAKLSAKRYAVIWLKVSRKRRIVLSSKRLIIRFAYERAANGSGIHLKSFVGAARDLALKCDAWRGSHSKSCSQSPMHFMRSVNLRPEVCRARRAFLTTQIPYLTMSSKSEGGKRKATAPVSPPPTKRSVPSGTTSENKPNVLNTLANH